MSESVVSLTPDEYRQAVEAAAKAGDAASLAAALSQLARRRHPPAISASVDPYDIPPASALLLYQTDPARHRGYVLSSLGPPQSPDFWARLSAIASHVYSRRDWDLLGILAQRVDAALSVSRALPSVEPDPNGKNTAEGHMPLPERVRIAFESVFDVSQNRLDGASYVRAALGYFRVFPASSSVPPDLIVELPRKKQQPAAAIDSGIPLDWPLLRLFWKKYRGAWNTLPESVEQLSRCPNPFLSLLVEHLRKNTEAPLPRRAVRFPANPFPALAGKFMVKASRQRKRPSPQVGQLEMAPGEPEIPAGRGFRSVRRSPPQRVVDSVKHWFRWGRVDR